MKRQSIQALVRERFGISARTGLVLGALGVTLVATVVSGREDPAPEQVTPRVQAAPATDVHRAAQEASPTSAQALRALEDLDLARLERARRDKPVADLFLADPVNAVAPGLPASGIPHESVKAPEPPLPFTYLGRVVDEGRLSVFLARGADSFSVREGETVERYRVDKITDTDIRFTYLPTRAHKVLAVPALN